MKINMYSIFDSKSAMYSNPDYQHNNAMAIRNFTDLANNKDTIISKHPEDYSLFLMGTYDNLSGKITQQNPQSLVTAASVIIQSPIDLTQAPLTPQNGLKSKQEVK